MNTMSENPVRLGQREQQIVELLLQGCDNDEIARQLKMARRTVKAHFNRLFLRFGIQGGIKRVKLATLMYRRQLLSEGFDLSSLPEIEVAETPTCNRERGALRVNPGERELTSAGKHKDLEQPEPAELLEVWERSLLGLGEPTTQDQFVRKVFARKGAEKQLA